MECSVEISMYPLNKEYVEAITAFILGLRKHPFINLETNGMSTQVFGEYDKVMKAINHEMKISFQKGEKVVFNLKVINSQLQEKPTI